MRESNTLPNCPTRFSADFVARGNAAGCRKGVQPMCLLRQAPGSIQPLPVALHVCPRPDDPAMADAAVLS